MKDEQTVWLPDGSCLSFDGKDATLLDPIGMVRSKDEINAWLLAEARWWARKYERMAYEDFPSGFYPWPVLPWGNRGA